MLPPQNEQAGRRPHIVVVAKGGSEWLGGRHYTINLLESLTRFRQSPEAYDLSVLVNGRDELGHYEPLRPRLKICADLNEIEAPYTLTNKIRWRAKREIAGWLSPRLEEALLRIGATFAYPVSSRIVPSAEWICDFQYLHFPDAASRQEITSRKLDFANIARNAAHIVLSSEHGQNDCHRAFPHSRGRTSVFKFRVFSDPSWLSCEPTECVRLYHLPERFVLISNWMAPTKNHAVVLEALARIPIDRRKAIHVVSTGQIYDARNPGFYNDFLNNMNRLGVRENVTLTGVIPKADQIQLLRAALAYLQPSLFEGWNTGVEEAHLLGKPILLSDIPVHREQSPPKSRFFDPRRPEELATLLEETFATEPSRNGSRYDPEAERTAVKSYEELQRASAQCFLDIAGVRVP